METFLYIVFFISCIVMVGSVLLQPGKTDAGALFTSGVSSASMNPRGTASILSKLTIATATIFMLSALMLSLPALTGKVSVLQTQGEEDSAPAATETNSNSNTANSNANSNTEANAPSTSDDSETKEDSKDEAKAADEQSEEKSDEKSEEKAADDKKEDSEEKTDDKKEDSK